MTEEQYEEMRNDRNVFDKKRNDRITQALAALVGLGILLTIGFLYVNHTNRQNDLRWCSLIVGLDDRNQSVPQNPDPAAQDFVRDIHELRRSLHCPRSTDQTPTPTRKATP